MESLKAWWVRQRQGVKESLECPVTNLEEAAKQIEHWTNQDLADDSVEWNAGGLMTDRDGEWEEYYDEEGRDIDQIMEGDED